MTLQITPQSHKLLVIAGACAAVVLLGMYATIVQTAVENGRTPFFQSSTAAAKVATHSGRRAMASDQRPVPARQPPLALRAPSEH